MIANDHEVDIACSGLSFSFVHVCNACNFSYMYYLLPLSIKLQNKFEFHFRVRCAIEEKACKILHISIRLMIVYLLEWYIDHSGYSGLSGISV